MSRQVTNYKQTIKALQGVQNRSEKVLQRAVSDARTRIPGWVASEVTKVYNIKKSEVTPAKVKNGKATKPVGSIRVNGETVSGLEIIYRGRVLSPVHFGMTPKAPKSGAYTLKAEIIKGHKVTLGKKKKLTKKQLRALGKNLQKQGVQTSEKSPKMLMPTGAKSEDKIQYIPFQRKSVDRNDIHPVKTLSLPQMVSSKRTQEAINNTIAENLQKRFGQLTKQLE